MKDFLDKLRENSMMQFVYIMGIIVAVCLFLIIYFSYFYKGVSYDDIKKKMIKAGEKYCSENCDKLFSGVDSISIPASTLVDGGYIKDLNKLAKNKKDTCSGEVLVRKSYHGYNYISKLSCGNKYRDRSIFNVITDKDNYVASGNGLHKMNDSSVYRGDDVKNYIKLNEKDDYLYRIVKVNQDGSLLLILNSYDSSTLSVWDDRYNSETSRKDGINKFSISRAKEKLIKFLSSEHDYSYVSQKAINYEYCIGPRNDSDTINDGSIECSKTESGYISLIPVYDIISASLDSSCEKVSDSMSCSNYNYLSDDDDYERELWTITPVEETSNMVYKFDNECIESDKANSKHSLRFVFTISGDENYLSGDGSISTPYILNK